MHWVRQPGVRTETRNAADAPDTDVVPAATSSGAPAVDVKDGTYGKSLVDEKGRTLYLFGSSSTSTATRSPPSPRPATAATDRPVRYGQKAAQA
ncbi:hypothetical protein ACH4D3_12570 [Streptomyces sp. NPDC018026]|uniref:hypothetical protein n=1 Tax=Streptomyces sp. NPDC018026 TaxID=3365031 RepID=UPI0037A3FFC6